MDMVMIAQVSKDPQVQEGLKIISEWKKSGRSPQELAAEYGFKWEEMMELDQFVRATPGWDSASMYFLAGWAAHHKQENE